MDAENIQPSCSFDSKLGAGEEIESDPLAMTDLIPVNNIKTEEIFIKEEGNWGDEDYQNFDDDYSMFASDSCEASVIDQSTPATSENKKPVTKLVPIVTYSKKTSANKKKKILDVSDDSNANISENVSKSNQMDNIRSHFTKYKRDFLSARKPSSKFTQFGDEYHIFGQYIAKGLRSIKDKRTRAITQWKLCNILHDAHIKQFN